MRSQFEKVVQNFELKRVGGAPKDYQLTPLGITTVNPKLLYDLDSTFRIRKYNVQYYNVKCLHLYMFLGSLYLLLQ